MSHNGPGREPLSRDKCQNKKSLTSQYSFCLGHLVVVAQENSSSNFIASIAKLDSKKFLISTGFVIFSKSS